MCWVSKDCVYKRKFINVYWEKTGIYQPGQCVAGNTFTLLIYLNLCVILLIVVGETPSGNYHRNGLSSQVCVDVFNAITNTVKYAVTTLKKKIQIQGEINDGCGPSKRARTWRSSRLSNNNWNNIKNRRYKKFHFNMNMLTILLCILRMSPICFFEYFLIQSFSFSSHPPFVVFSPRARHSCCDQAVVGCHLPAQVWAGDLGEDGGAQYWSRPKPGRGAVTLQQGAGPVWDRGRQHHVYTGFLWR